MTVWDFATEHPGWTLLYILALGPAVGMLLSAPVKALREWKRPGDCPRCNGTGREPRP